MILVSGSSGFQLNTAALSELERNIVQEKQVSRVTYRYPSLAALEFELRLRSNTVKAARDLYASGAGFATFDTSKCNEQYWTRTENGGFQLKRGVLPSTGIRDIFENGHLYAFECAGAIIIMLYKAVLDTVGSDVFDIYFQDLFLRDWQYDRDLRLITTYNRNEAYPGDVLYFKNPDHDPDTPEWQGENVIKLEDDSYFGHGIGIGSGQYMINMLNQMRKDGSTISAYLQDLVVFPDAEYIRQLTFRDGWPEAAGDGLAQYAIVGKIGLSTIVYR